MNTYARRSWECFQNDKQASKYLDKYKQHLFEGAPCSVLVSMLRRNEISVEIVTEAKIPDIMRKSGFFGVTIEGRVGFCPNCGSILCDVVEIPEILPEHCYATYLNCKKADIARKYDTLKSWYRYDEHRKNAEILLEKVGNRENSVTCPNCGTTITEKDNSWATQPMWFNQERESLAKMSRDELYEAFKGRLWGLSMDWHFACDTLMKSRNRAESFLCEAEAIVPKAVPFDIANKIKNSDHLADYILSLIQTENIIYALTRLLPDMYYRQMINRMILSAKGKQAMKVNEELTSFKAAVKAAEEAQERAEDAVNELQSSGVPHAHCPLVPYPDKPKEPVLEKAGLFNKKKVLAQNEALTAAYLSELKAYEEECHRCDEENSRRQKAAKEEAAKRWQLDIEAARKKADAAKAELDKAKSALAEAEKRVAAEIEEAKNLPTPASEAQALLDKDVAETEELLKKTFAARNELYACGVIFEKYRDVVALSSFYEYLMSGRCTKLEGPDGAYNLYESEIRANRVIAQLDQVIDSLEQIKQNQYMMYSAMKQIDNELGQLNNAMSEVLSAAYSIERNTAQTAGNTARIAADSDTIAQNSSVIARNTAATAFYAKKNAELTNAMGYLVALK